jgi:Protein of unknown function (DUF4238)
VSFCARLRRFRCQLLPRTVRWYRGIRANDEQTSDRFRPVLRCARSAHEVIVEATESCGDARPCLPGRPQFVIVLLFLVRRPVDAGRLALRAVTEPCRAEPVRQASAPAPTSRRPAALGRQTMPSSLCQAWEAVPPPLDSTDPGVCAGHPWDFTGQEKQAGLSGDAAMVTTCLRRRSSSSDATTLLPGSYLRRFADDHDQLTMVMLPGDVRVRVSIDDATVVRNFYVVRGRDGSETDVAEDDFSEVEARAAVAISALIDRRVWPILDTVRAGIADWVALQYLRVPWVRQACTRVRRGIQRRWRRVQGKPRRAGYDADTAGRS